MKPEVLYVHAGSFHSDDVMCAALAEIAFPGIRVERVYDVTESMMNDDRAIVADIGGGKYDHHQSDARRRENGDKYAACGLLFEDIWEDIFPDKASAERFINNYIIPIERSDNGIVNNPLSAAVRAFNPAWDEEGCADEAFREAADMMKRIVQREVSTAKSELRARGIVEEALAASELGLVILEAHIPWEAVLAPSDAKYVIYPSKRGGFNIQAVPVEEGSFESKIPLPEEWHDEPPKGCRFVHASRFLAAFEDRESAVAAGKALVKRQQTL